MIAIKELQPHMRPKEGAQRQAKDIKSAVDGMSKEIDLLSSLKHPNIVTFLGGNRVECFLITELMRGSLGDLMYDKNGDDDDNRTPEFEWDAKGRKIMFDAATGLEFLHRQRRVHYDLKPQNVLISEGIVPVGKLSDVGSCKLLTKA